MTADPLDQVLRLVSEGRLTADEAVPILAALDAVADAQAATADATATVDGIRGHAAESLGRFARRPGEGAGPAAYGAGPGPASSLRIEVRDAGRSVVNLRLPLAVGRFALDRVPGLSGDQVARVREAMNSGFRGPVLVVDDDGDGVRISIE
jgi:hypothetical protein